MIGYTAQAQLANGSIAPDFTVTDLNGNTWNLYDLLDEGKTVVIDLYATWCGPCWNYHQAHYLRDLYNAYGPEGTNEMFVIGIESDPSTSVAAITGGPGGNTIGDWTAGIPYPMADNAAVGDAYNLAYYPTIYSICPNRIVTEIGQVSVAAHYAHIDNCEQASGVNNAALLTYEGYEGAFCGDLTFEPAVTLQNLGNANLTSATIQLSANGEVVNTVDWTGDLAIYNIVEVTLGELNLTDDTDLVIEVIAANGQDDEDTSNNLVEKSLRAPVAAVGMLTMEVKTDDYGYETYWQITNDAGDVIASGGNTAVGPNGGGNQTANASGPGAYGANQTITEQVEVTAGGCYELLVVDDYGDGMCCTYGNGSFKLTDAEGNILTQGGAFEDDVDSKFAGNPSLAIPSLDELSQLSVFPNPTASNLSIRFDLNENMPLQVAVYNTLGQRLQTVASENFAAGAHQLNVDASVLANGIYYVAIQSEDKQVTTRFVVNK
ncbi:MAG: hypothetical protein DHS20C18_01690 [Saprospiraceae bacterium]|nr:MAG: hypothetical protein DHS20C18_01690 [Saprospiraceae bacterium]